MLQSIWVICVTVSHELVILSEVQIEYTYQYWRGLTVGLYTREYLVYKPLMHERIEDRKSHTSQACETVESL